MSEHGKIRILFLRTLPNRADQKVSAQTATARNHTRTVSSLIVSRACQETMVFLLESQNFGTRRSLDFSSRPAKRKLSSNLNVSAAPRICRYILTSAPFQCF